jgi:GNAT superfamily N-acetyltransferase
MNEIILTRVDALDVGTAIAITRRLTKQNSEFQKEIILCMEGDGSSITPLAIWRVDGCAVAWAASHVWRDMPTLEMFTDPNFRNNGHATALAASLRAAGHLPRDDRPIAVFAPATASIARRLGFTEVCLFERRGSDWELV